jgi:energy-coupling factor transporter ATP-binding protein EcfA2
MNLLGFRVQTFRSVVDSGWITTDQVTALIGTNESGKSNVLVPLWKLSPASEGKIDPVADYPRNRFHEIRGMAKKPTFIVAQFALDESFAKELAELMKVAPEAVGVVTVSRDFDDKTDVQFDKAGKEPIVDRANLIAAVVAAKSDIDNADPVTGEEAIRAAATAAIVTTLATLQGDPTQHVPKHQRQSVQDALGAVSLDDSPVHSVAAPRFGQLRDGVMATFIQAVDEGWQKARDLVLQRMPKFVYYSNYGNLDSEIYLPHVIDNMRRTDLGPRDQSKARTLKVLFDFVGLKPEEIQELGKDDVILSPGATPTPDQEKQIDAVAKRKKERDVLLQSASSKLTLDFRAWWKQGTYKFRFAADGNHFRIWVSDDKRPEDIELESRSTGLQWFLSFYLIFLVESERAHQHSILLLDEPGLSLHPLAQGDLSKFFDGLAETNQLIYTTHSPFMVDADHLDRARAVFRTNDGLTQVSPDLRAATDKSDRSKSVYAAYAAVGMSVSDVLLLGAQPTVVEGPSDQHYFSAMKNYLIGSGQLQPQRELVFLPSGGVKGTKAISALVMGRDDKLPFVVVDSDEIGSKFAKDLRSGMYSGDKPRVLTVGDFTAVPNAETEDLFPQGLIARVVDRYLPKPKDLETDFADVVKAGEAIVPQIEAYAGANGIALEEGWKVELARRVKAVVLRGKADELSANPAFVEAWRKIFMTIDADASPVESKATPATGL